MKRYLIMIAVALLCTSCATIRIHTDFNTSYDFSSLKTYSWLDKAQAPSADTRINNDLVIERVRSAVDRTLAAAGFEKASHEYADFIVSWHGGIEKKIRVETIDHFYSPYGYGALYRGDPYWDVGSAVRTSTTREYEVGTLIVDILDPVQHKLIWRGSGSDTIRDESDPGETGRKINEAVAAILKDFPPVKKY